MPDKISHEILSSTGNNIKTGKILCIEDEPDIRLEIGEELRYSGFEVLLAANGNEALEILKTETPALIICDILMPGLSGLDLFRIIRDSHPQLDGIPFLFLSALANRSHILDGLRLGADDYLTKPIDFELLQIKVRTKLSLVSRVRLHETGQEQDSENDSDDGKVAALADIHLSPREKQVLEELVKGHTNMQIAGIVGLSEHTISDYIKSIYKKLQVSSRVQATRMALKAGLVSLKSR